jgi:hypothetical protein
MTTGPIDPLEPRPAGAPGAARKAGPGGPQASPPEGSAASPAFQALLERLQATAQELQERARGVEKPAELQGAVDRARQSLDDALALGGRLLEAWRAERQSSNPKDSHP